MQLEVFSHREFNYRDRNGLILCAIKGGRCYFTIVTKRDKENLQRCIGQWIREGSTIFSDQWGAYNGLQQKGYFHFTVNHSENFVDPITHVHTQRIESMWNLAKDWMKTHKYKDRQYLQDYIMEFCYRYNHKSDFLNLIRDLYK